MRAFDYLGAYAYSVTVNTANRSRPFEDERAVRDCLDVLTTACDRYAFSVHAYCFMPNHVHLLVEGDEYSSLVAFMKNFKQLSSYRHRQRTGQALWQRSYYERVLRTDEDVSAVVDYIWDNPVQAGYVAFREEYRFSGPRDAMGPDRPEGLSLRSPSSDGVEAPSLLHVGTLGARSDV